MSSYRTHALSGAVLSTGVGVIISSMPWAAMLVPFRSSAMFDLLGQFAVLGAISALWPDIDEPNSFASRSSVTVFALLGCLSGSALVVRFPAHDSASASMITLALALIVGALIGALVGYLVPWGIQTIAGGHRRGTHSWLTFLALAMVGCVLLPWIPGIGAIFCWLAWGGFVHVLGDIVTPSGVPVWYPVSNRRLHLFPPGIAEFGEWIFVAVIIAVGILIGTAIT